MFITFEGLDFCGKSTQVELLEKYLINRGKTVRIIREPGGTAISEKVRSILLDKKNNEMHFESELLLFASARAQLVREVIIPSLAKGEYVISDRYHDSSIAYQGYGRGIDIDFVVKLQSFAIGTAIPDITFFIDIPVDEFVTRKMKVKKGELDRMERSKIAFYEKVRNGYLEIAAKDKRFISIDGLLSIDNIQYFIQSNIDRFEKEGKASK
jgi:dTMP kinase